MPAPSHRQILVGGQRRPGGEAALFQVAVIPARGAEHAGRVEGMSEDRRYARGRIAIVVVARRQREEGPVEIGRLPPGQERARVEDLHPAHQQHDKADRIDPVADAHQRGMPEDEAALRRGARGQGGGKRRQIQVSDTGVKGPICNTFRFGPAFRAAIVIFVGRFFQRALKPGAARPVTPSRPLKADETTVG